MIKWREIVGSLRNETWEEYDRGREKFLTYHGLKEFMRCPFTFNQRRSGLLPPIPVTESFLIGKATHAFLLEGRDVYKNRFVIGGPQNPRTGKAYGQSSAAFAKWAKKVEGRIALTPESDELVVAMAESVLRHSEASSLLKEGVAEHVARCEYEEMPCQARLDWLCPDGLVELKTTRNLDIFEHEVTALAYVHQVAFYRAMVRILTDVNLPVTFIAVEKTEPFRCGVWRVLEGVLKQAEIENEQGIRELVQCTENGTWRTRYENSRTIARL